MELLNLSKGAVLDLSKKAPELKQLMIGLGWDSHCDLDAIAYLADQNGTIRDTVYFGAKKKQGIYLNGDNLTGAGNGDDECIFCTFDSLPEWVANIKICVNIFGGGGFIGLGKKDFSSVKGSYVRLVDNQNGNELCRYNLNEDGKGYNAFHFADLNKSGNDWSFTAIGQGLSGNVEKLRQTLTK